MIFRDSRTNYIINGAMTFHQRFVGTAYNYSGTGTVNGCVADRWRLSVSGTTSKNFLIVRSTDVPTYAQSGEQYAYSSSLTINTGTSLGTSDSLFPFQYLMEGYDANQLRGKSVNISFWFKSSVTGSYALSLSNGIVTSPIRTYTTLFSVNAANTWELKSVNISIEDFAIQANGNTTDIGLVLSIAGISGASTLQAGTLDSWITSVGRPTTSTSAVNYGGTTGAVLRLTGVQMVLGNDTPASYSYYGGSIAGELAACQRYYEKSYNTEVVPGTVVYEGSVYGTSSNVMNTLSGRNSGWAAFKVSKRAVPTVTTYNPLTGATNSYRDDSGNINQTGGFDFFSTTGARFNTAGTATSNATFAHFTADAEF